jgi:hypothetical protein
VFPPGTEGPLIASFGFCSTPLLLDEELQAVCAAGDITLQDMVHDAMGRYPSVLFSHVNSKFDVVQREYYAGVAATSLERPLYISKAAYTDAMNVLLKGYSERHANYVSFVVTASQHCYTPYSLMYTADTTGPKGNASSSSTSSSGSAATTLVDWLQHLPVPPGASAESECDGEALAEADWAGHDYCDAAQEGKTFTAAAASVVVAAQPKARRVL